VDQDAVAALVAKSRARQRIKWTPAVAIDLRRQAAVSQEDVASALGVTRSAVCRWERGARVPTGDRAERYLGLLRQLIEEGRR
jgi:DNA-binding transcriptional regulator YiaG